MDKLAQWKKKLEAAKEYGLYFDYSAIEKLLGIVEQQNERIMELESKKPVIKKARYMDLDD